MEQSAAVASADEAAQTTDHLADADGDPLRAAYERGKHDKLKGMSRKAVPGEYRGEEHSREAMAWACGHEGKSMPEFTDR